MPGALFPVQYFRPFVPPKKAGNNSVQKKGQVAGGEGNGDSPAWVWFVFQCPSRSELWPDLRDIHQVVPSSLSSRNLELALFHHQIGFSFLRGIGTVTFRFSFSR